jgi:hypothetical protein
MLMGGTAHAALTADQVWQSWKDAATMIGVEVTAATENKDGGKLTLNGVTIAPAGEEGIKISDMVLTEQSDGSVTIAPGASIGAEWSDYGSGSVKLVHDGLTLTAREDGGGLVYDFSAAKLDVVYDTTTPGYSFDETPPPDMKSSGTFGFSGLTGVYSDRPGTNRSFGLELKADQLAYDTVMDDPMMELKQTTKSVTDNVELAVGLTMPSAISLADIMQPSDFGTALKEGLALTMTTKQGDSNGSMNQESPYFPMNMAIKAGGGDASLVFNKDTFNVQSVGTGLELEVTSDAMPAPVKVTSGPIQFGLTTPVIAGDVAGDYGVVMKLSQFTVNEEAWALVDPTGALKRDAADLAVDISGKTKFDLVAMIEADEMGMEPPMPAPESLNITELGLKVAGAALGGTGAFTFDNSMGIPMPLGEANVSITGANALIDGLIATGLMAQEDAMGARMMMGAFMSPGAGPDELTSKIEARPGFEIYVNGQRIQ